MFNKLQNRWKVSSGRLILIIATFAVSGSLCGFAARKIIGLLGIDIIFWWVILYIVLVTLLWPITVLFISLPLGQYKFFKQYLKKIYIRINVVNS